MAPSLPAEGSFPDLVPEQYFSAGLGIEDADVKALVESQHYALAYYGRGHLSLYWPSGQVRETGAVLDQVLGDFVIVPRLHSKNVYFHALVDSSNGGSIRVQCTDGGGSGNTQAFAAGALVAVGGTWDLSRGELASVMQVLLLATAGPGPYADLRALAIWDADLAVGDLP